MDPQHHSPMCTKHGVSAVWTRPFLALPLGVQCAAGALGRTGSPREQAHQQRTVETPEGNEVEVEVHVC